MTEGLENEVEHVAMAGTLEVWGVARAAVEAMVAKVGRGGVEAVVAATAGAEEESAAVAI